MGNMAEHNLLTSSRLLQECGLRLMVVCSAVLFWNSSLQLRKGYLNTHRLWQVDFTNTSQYGKSATRSDLEARRYRDTTCLGWTKVDETLPDLVVQLPR